MPLALMRIATLSLLEWRKLVICEWLDDPASQTSFDNAAAPTSRARDRSGQDFLADPSIERLHADPAHLGHFTTSQQQRPIIVGLLTRAHRRLFSTNLGGRHKLYVEPNS